MKKSSQMKSVNMLGASLDILTINPSYCTEDYGHALFNPLNTSTCFLILDLEQVQTVE